MTRFLYITLMLFIMIISSGFILLDSTNVYAGDEPIESKIIKILQEDSSSEKITVGILDFNISNINTEITMPNDQRRFIENGLAVEITSQLINTTKRLSLQNRISIIERSMLNEILQEKALQASGITEKTISEIGGIQGLDAIILGRVLLGRNNAAEIVPLPVHIELYKWAIEQEKAGVWPEDIVNALPGSKVDPHTGQWAQDALDAGFDPEVIFSAFKSAGTFKKSRRNKTHPTDIRGLSARLLTGGTTFFIKTVKVVRVRDGKVLGVAEEEKGLFKKQ